MIQHIFTELYALIIVLQLATLGIVVVNFRFILSTSVCLFLWEIENMARYNIMVCRFSIRTLSLFWSSKAFQLAAGQQLVLPQIYICSCFKTSIQHMWDLLFIPWRYFSRSISRLLATCCWLNEFWPRFS
jgi:hypothetical protein